MRQAVWLFVLVLGLGLAGAARAQDAWVQIEAQPSLREAEERARAYSGVFPNVAGFRMTTGWYAIALGPYTPDEAARQLALLKGERMIPADSFIDDGRRFGLRFWPVGAAAGAAPEAPAIAAPAAPGATPDPAPVEAPEETLREARASEALLTAEERRLIQTALQWAGHYDAAIDGAFGPGTRRSMAEWQAAAGHPETGVLTGRQRQELIGAYQAELAALGLETVRDQAAGIEITMPTAMVRFDHYEPPFVHYNEKDGSGVRVLLISQQGDLGTLFGLYDILQTLEIMPLEGFRERGKSSFVLTGQNDRIHAHAQAELRGGLVKGFILVWRPEDAERMARVLEAMRTSFAPFGDRALDESLGATAGEPRPGLLAGLEVRRPSLSRTGFFIDAAGTVLTTDEVVQGCGRITVDGGVEADLAHADPALGIAVLTPREPLAPPAHAEFQTGRPRLNSEVAVAGFAYEDVLDAPVMTFGTLADLRGLGGEEDRARLALSALPGDAGGPVFDATGSVLGMLLPKAAGDGRVLPEGVAFAASSGAIAAVLAERGLAPRPSSRAGAMAAEDLTRHALGMTVLVSCWE